MTLQILPGPGSRHRRDPLGRDAQGFPLVDYDAGLVGMARNVFISYSSQDHDAADTICRALEARGIRCWMAPRDILPGKPWAESILDALENASAMLLLFTASANVSVQIHREIDRAVHKGVPVIPLRLENVLPTRTMEYFISTTHWLDVHQPPLDQHMDRVAQAIAALLATTRAGAAGRTPRRRKTTKRAFPASSPSVALPPPPSPPAEAPPPPGAASMDVVPLAASSHTVTDKPAGRAPARETDSERERAAMRAGDAMADVSSTRTAVRRTTVGREEQRGQLLRAYARVKEGRSLIVAVTGEPGMGKTSIIEDFFGDLGARGDRATVARGRCSESLAGSEAYLPILELLDNLLHPSVGPSLDSLIKSIAPTWYVQVAARSAEVSLLREASPVASQERMKRELGALVQELSRWQPLVLFIDDLHWADVSTIDMLNYLAGRFSDMRLLVLTSYRPSDMALAKHPFLGIRSDLQSRGLFEEVGLPFLERKDVEEYLALQFPEHAFPPDFASVVHAKTEGSPLFMADLVRYLRDTGGMTEENGTWVLARAVSDVPRDLPESVRGMIARKIEQVDESDRRLLVAASVQGHEFDSAIVAEAIAVDAAEVEDRLEALERVQVFVRRGDELEFPDGTLTVKYQFVHVLYQNVLYASLQPTRRVSLSGSIVRALAAHYGDEAPGIAGRLAVLYETARDFANSAKYFYMAAQRAVSLFAFREALSLAERGLAGLRGLPDGPGRQQLELGLQMTRGRALRAVKGWAAPEVEPAFARARQLCGQLDDPPELSLVLCALTLFHLIGGNLRECRDRADELIVKAEHSGDPAFVMAAYLIAGVSREFIGDFVESSRLLERARDLHVPAEQPVYTAMYGSDLGMAARAVSSRPLWALGYPDRADQRARETLAIARSQRQPMMLALTLVVLQGIHLYRGEAAEALTMGDEIIALGREYEQPQETEWSRSFQGSALAVLGRTSEGIDLLKGSLRVQQSIGAGLVRPAFLAMLADALGQEGRVEEGLEAVVEGLAHAERTFEGGYVAELHRMRGELLRLAGNQAGAEESLRTALDYARRQQAKSLELRAATSLARLQAASGRAVDARAELASVYDWFTEGYNTMDLVAARRLLSETE